MFVLRTTEPVIAISYLFRDLRLVRTSFMTISNSCLILEGAPAEWKRFCLLPAICSLQRRCTGDRSVQISHLFYWAFRTGVSHSITPRYVTHERQITVTYFAMIVDRLFSREACKKISDRKNQSAVIRYPSILSTVEQHCMRTFDCQMQNVVFLVTRLYPCISTEKQLNEIVARLIVATLVRTYNKLP